MAVLSPATRAAEEGTQAPENAAEVPVDGAPAPVVPVGHDAEEAEETQEGAQAPENAAEDPVDAAPALVVRVDHDAEEAEETQQGAQAPENTAADPVDAAPARVVRVNHDAEEAEEPPSHRLIRASPAKKQRRQLRLAAAATQPTHLGAPSHLRDLCTRAAVSLTQTMTRALTEQRMWRTQATAGGTVCRMEADEEEDMRRLYLLMVEDCPDQILMQLAMPLKEALLRSDAGLELLDGPAKEITLVAGGRAKTCSKEIFSVGRKDTCDVQMQDPSVSRMHVWVFNLPGAIVVVDGWSCCGTRVTEWDADDQEPPRSVPGARCAFIVPHGAPAKLHLGQRGLTLNPKLCVVCWERARALRLPCGHQAVCKHCAGRLAECPVCRARIPHAGVQEATRACIGKTYMAPV